MEQRIPKTMQEAVIYYSDMENCVQLMIRLRWADGVTCPHCKSDRVTRIKMQPRWQCNNKACRKQFTPKVGTIMEDSPLGLDKWLMAIWMLTNCKNGVSSYEIHRALGVTQKTAWFMLHRIRYAFGEQPTGFEGIVEADETYIGGIEKNKHEWLKTKRGRGTVGKAAVMGLLERGGKARTKVIPAASKDVLHEEIVKHVKPGATMHTDALKSYQGLPAEYVHEFVDHAIEYVKDGVHTNSLENFFSLLKRMVRGTYVAIDPVHLKAYLDEQTFRYNERKGNDASRFLFATASVTGKRLTYKTLIRRSEA